MRIAILLINSFSASLGYVFFKELVGHFPGCFILFYRHLFSLLMLHALCISKKQHTLNRSASYWAHISFIAVFEIVLFGFFFQSGLKSIPLAEANILLATTPIVTSLITLLIDQNATLCCRFWLSILAGFFSILILFYQQLAINHILSVGIVTILMAVCSWVAAMVYFSKCHFTVPVLVIVRDQHIIASVIFLIIVMIMTTKTNVNLLFNAHLMIQSTLFAFFGTVGYLAYTNLLKKHGIVFSSLSCYIIPLFSLLWGYLLFHEHITRYTITSLILVMLSLYLSQHIHTKQRSKDKT